MDSKFKGQSHSLVSNLPLNMFLCFYSVITVTSRIVIGHTEYTSCYVIVCVTEYTESTSCLINIYAIYIYVHVIYKICL